MHCPDRRRRPVANGEASCRAIHGAACGHCRSAEAKRRRRCRHQRSEAADAADDQSWDRAAAAADAADAGAGTGVANTAAVAESGDSDSRAGREATWATGRIRRRCLRNCCHCRRCCCYRYCCYRCCRDSTLHRAHRICACSDSGALNGRPRGTARTRGTVGGVEDADAADAAVADTVEMGPVRTRLPERLEAVGPQRPRRKLNTPARRDGAMRAWMRRAMPRPPWRLQTTRRNEVKTTPAGRRDWTPHQRRAKKQTETRRASCGATPCRAAPTRLRSDRASRPAAIACRCRCCCYRRPQSRRRDNDPHRDSMTRPLAAAVAAAARRAETALAPRARWRGGR